MMLQLPESGAVTVAFTRIPLDRIYSVTPGLPSRKTWVAIIVIAWLIPEFFRGERKVRIFHVREQETDLEPVVGLIWCLRYVGGIFMEGQFRNVPLYGHESGRKLMVIHSREGSEVLYLSSLPPLGGRGLRRYCETVPKTETDRQYAVADVANPDNYDDKRVAVEITSRVTSVVRQYGGGDCARWPSETSFLNQRDDKQGIRSSELGEYDRLRDADGELV
jgi:hypothetical protein